MVRPVLALIFFSLLTLPAAFAAETQDQKFEAFLKKEWEEGKKRHPERSTYLGDHRYDDRWTDMSVEAIESRKQQVRDSLKALKSIHRNQLSEAHRLNYDLYLYRLLFAEEGLQFPDELLVMDQMGSWITQMPEVLQRMPLKTEKDFKNLMARLEKVPEVLKQTRTLMELGMEKGITPPQVTLKPVFEQFKEVNKPAAENPFLLAFKNKPAETDAKRFEKYKAQARKLVDSRLLPEFKNFQTFFEQEYYPKARSTQGWSELPNGKKWYNYRARYFTTTDQTAEEIHQLGLKEVGRIRGEMQKVLKRLKFKGSLEEFNASLRKDDQHYFTNAEDLLRGYRDIAKRADAEMVKLFGRLPRTPYGVKATPDYMAPGAPTAYYYSGNLESGQAGFFYANTYNLRSRPKYEMEALTLHEAVPGHHLQISLAQEMENVPEFRKHYSVTAFVEGWGLYAESLGEDMGFYQDPYSKYGQLTYEMWRAIRLVVDTGIHMKGWSRDKAIDYFAKNSGKARHDIEVEVDRYIVWPGQALAYKMGELKMKELKARARKALKTRFDIREFHDTLLGQGALPLKVLEAHIDNWIAMKRKS